MNKISETVSRLAKPVIERHGCELWDVEYVREAGKWYLRVYIDKDGGVSISDCEAVSRELDAMLDEADPIEGSYIFEVSSAGAERELKRPSDFEKFMGSTVEVKLYRPRDGQKAFIGTLVGYSEGSVSVMVNEKELAFEKSEIAQVRLRIV